MAKNEFNIGKRNSYSLQCGTMMTVISPGDCTLQCACGSGIMTMNSPSSSTLQCDTWLWDGMPLNSPKRPPYWNITSGFDFDHYQRSRHVILHQSANFYPHRTTLSIKNDVMPIFKMAELSHLGF